MKRLLLLILVLLLATSVATAGGFSYKQKKQLREQGYSYQDIRKMERGQSNIEPTYKYKSSTGNRYQYDLSNPSDQLKYELDVGAQLKDSLRIPINPRVDLDRGLGQYGGGIDK